MDNETKIKVSFNNSVTNAKKLDNYAEKLKEIYSILSAIDKGKLAQMGEFNITLSKVKTNTSDIEKNTSKFAKNMNNAFNVGKIYIFVKGLGRLARGFGDVIQKSSQYVENVNLLEVAYANIDKKTGEFNEDIKVTSERIEKLIDNMAEVYGFDESRLARSFGIFKQMANAMELPAETSENLSELMVKLSNDVSSLYNIDLSRAENALQSALAGQVRPIRTATGADITEKTLQKTVDTLGLERSISDLNYVEKRLIMIISLTNQLKNAQGDYGRTINSVANQIRIMHEQWSRLSRAVGNVFYKALENILPYLNAVLMVLTEIFNLIAGLVGFKMPDFDYSGLAGVSDTTSDIIDGMNEAGSSVDKLKDKMSGLRSFDKLNVITTPKDKSSGISGGIDPKILEAFNTAFEGYDDKMEEIRLKANEIRDAILDWLGFTDGTYKNLKLIAGVLVTVASLKIISGLAGIITGTSGLYTAIKKIVTLFKQGQIINIISGKLANGIIKISNLFSPTGLLIAGIIALAGVFIYAYKNSEEFRNSVNNLVEVVKDTLTPILELLSTIITTIIKIGKDLLDKVIKPIIKAIADTLTPILKIVIDVLTILIDKAVKPLIELISNVLTPIVQALGWVFENIILPVIQKVIDAFTWLLENVLTPVFNGINKFVSETLTGVIDFIVGVFTLDWKKAWEGIKEIFSGIFGSLWDIAKEVLDKIIDKLQKAWDKFKGLIKDMSTNQETGHTGIKGFFENWWGGVKTIFGWKENGGIYSGGKWHNIATYATGGLPPVGQMFVARENGAELVGQIGGHTAVMNNDQIVGSVSDGVYRAMMSANRNQGSQIINLYLDADHKIGTYTLEQLQNMAKTDGKPITIG